MVFTRSRSGCERQGFTLIELLVVIVILGILIAIAVPSYLGFRGNAHERRKANVRSAIPAAESYYQTGVQNSYTGLTGTTLRMQAPGVSTNSAPSRRTPATATASRTPRRNATCTLSRRRRAGNDAGSRISTITSGACSTDDGGTAAA